MPKAPAQQIAIERLITILDEDRLPAIAARGDMMGNAGDDDAGEPSHDATQHNRYGWGSVAPPVFSQFESFGRDD